MVVETLVNIGGYFLNSLKDPYKHRCVVCGKYYYIKGDD